MVSNQDKCYSLFDFIGFLTQLMEFKNRTIVIKYGGNAMIDAEVKHDVIKDIVLLKSLGTNPVMIHGGGPEIDDHMERVDLEPVFIDGQRKTDSDTLEIVEMVLCGKVNNELVKLIEMEGGNSIGLSGKDGGLIRAKKYLKRIVNGDDIITVDLGNVGEVTDIDTRIIDLLVSHDYIPVIAPIGMGEDYQDYNINADVLAGEIASALKASSLIYLTDVDGILEDSNRRETLLTDLDIHQAKCHVGGCIKGGMIPKVESAIDAIKGGVNEVYIVNGKIPHAVLSTFLDGYTMGTRIHAFC